MSRVSVPRLIADLEALKTQFGTGNASKILITLKQLADAKINDAALLGDLHETLMFLRAYPQNASIVRATEAQLENFAGRVELLANREHDLSSLEHPEMSGIAGLPLIDTFSYDIAWWLFKRHSASVDLYWEWFEDENRLGEAWPRLMPLLEEDSFVEAHVPYREWLRAARNGKPEFKWLMARFNELGVPPKQKTEIFNAQKIYLRWSPPYRTTRTGLRLPVSTVFYHRTPLIGRRDISFKAELDAPAPATRKLPAQQGERILDIAREASTVRYRELYGFTHGDPKSVFKAQLGRGTDLFVMSLPPDRRLPLRAYHSAMMFKNGVPVGYFEGLSLFERMESGFNLYYTFRDGETAWLYARTLNLMHRFTGVSSFVLDPYQIGHENEEGIESGAFWFYRKLGFRPVRRSILKLTEAEEEKIARRKGYRSSPATLRRLAAGPMILELDERYVGDWDSFAIRHIGFAVQRRMAQKFDGRADRMLKMSTRQVGEALGLNVRTWRGESVNVFGQFSMVLSLIDDLKGWSTGEKRLLTSIIRAKCRGDEVTYLRRMMKHERLRTELIKLGS